MKKTALYNIHTSLGAKMVPFAGFNMPIQYNGVISEHLCVRKNVGVFDVSHMGEFFVRGHGAKDFIQNITSNDVNKLFVGFIGFVKDISKEPSVGLYLVLLLKLFLVFLATLGVLIL